MGTIPQRRVHCQLLGACSYPAQSAALAVVRSLGDGPASPPILWWEKLLAVQGEGSTGAAKLCTICNGRPAGPARRGLERGICFVEGGRRSSQAANPKDLHTLLDSILRPLSRRASHTRTPGQSTQSPGSRRWGVESAHQRHLAQKLHTLPVSARSCAISQMDGKCAGGGLYTL
eukprot:6463575-Amphidinium_carterae.2